MNIPLVAFDDFDRQLKEKHSEYNTYRQYYLDIDKDVKFVCPTHGLLKQNAQNLIDFGCFKCNVCVHKQENCSLCTGEYKSIEEYVTLARQIWDYKYDHYSFETVTRNNMLEDRVRTFCSKHSYFLVEPKEHLEGKGCPMCRPFHHQPFIKKLIEKFGFKYDYSKIEYVNEYTQVILADRNGEFKIAPYLIDTLKR